MADLVLLASSVAIWLSMAILPILDWLYAMPQDRDR